MKLTTFTECRLLSAACTVDYFSHISAVISFSNQDHGEKVIPTTAVCDI